MLGFRVWDKERKKIYTSATVGCFNSSMGGILENWNESGGLCEAEDRYIPMQSTGLLDCAGNEIFENDIISIQLDAEIYEDESIVILVSSVVEFLSECLFEDCNGKRMVIKIIGNSQENPELLEKLK